MNFLDRRQRLPSAHSHGPIPNECPDAMAIALVCVFFATPFQATAAMCDLPDTYDYVECCGSNATVVNASLMDQRETPHEHNQGRLQLRLNVSYSGPGYTTPSQFDCANLTVIVRLGESRKTYVHTLTMFDTPGYIEDTPRFLFVPPFRQSDVYVESVACKMPKAMLGGRPSCESDGEKEREELALAEQLALAEERERRALEEERQRLNQERERLTQQREEQERLAQQLKEQDEFAQRQREYERRRLAQLQGDHQHQPQGEANGLQQFLTGFQSGMAIVQGLGNLLAVGTSIPNSIGQGAGSDSISEACRQAEMRIARRLEGQRTSGDEGLCTIYRSAAQMAESAKRELGSAGCPESHLRSMDQLIAAARRNARLVCV